MRRTVALALVTVAALAVGAAVWLRPPTVSARLADLSGGPDELAAAVCAHLFGEFADQIRGDAPVTEVRRGLRAAREVAGRAAQEDPRRFALAGAVGALQQAIELDDPASAEVAMAVAHAECALPPEDS